MSDAPKLYNCQEAGRLTGRSDTTIRKLAQRKGIGQRVGGTWIFTDADLELIRQIDPRGGTKGADGTIEYTAGFDRIKDRGPRKKPTPPESADSL